MGIIILRIIFIALVTLTGYFFPPFRLNPYAGAGSAIVLGALIIFIESRLRRIHFRIFWGSMVGTFTGVILGWFFGSIYKTIASSDSTSLFIRIFFLIIMPYIGFIVGSRKSEWLDPANFFSFLKEKNIGRSYKVLDTSVIIDGRIADICDTAFVEGSLVIPQFVLKELQLVADSDDALKRQRGRRGLDVLDHLQKSSHEGFYPQGGERKRSGNCLSG